MQLQTSARVLPTDSLDDTLGFFLAHDPRRAVSTELAHGLRALARGNRQKTIVRRLDEPWELVVERRHNDLYFSLLRTGRAPEVVLLDEPTSWASICESVSDVRTAPWSQLEDGTDSFVNVHVECPRETPLGFGATFTLRDRSGPTEMDVERADLHALLFRGEIVAEVRGRRVVFEDAYPFLVGEELLATAARLLGAWERGLSESVALRIGQMALRMRLHAGAVSLLFSQGDGGPAYTFPALSTADVVEAALTFARSLVRAVLRRDPGQAANLRLTALRRQLKSVSDSLSEVSKDDVKTNPEAESYRDYLDRRPASEPRPPSQRLRYGQRWRAIVPGINLRGTFLCGEKFIVDGRTETFGLDRATGKVLWRNLTAPAFSLPSPVGLARIGYDGMLQVFDLANGDILCRTPLLRRLESAPSAAVVQAPGLPSLLLVMEGRSHLLAVDLPTGVARWRMPWSGGSVRTKRAGRLMVMAGGDSALIAVDLASGGVVWRQRNRLRFLATPALVHDTVVALAGGAHSMAELIAVDVCSGELRWRVKVQDEPCSIEGGPLAGERSVVCVVRTRRGVKLVAYSVATGERIWGTDGPVAPLGTSWLVVDDVVIGNTPGGELIAIDSASGKVRYRNLLGSVLETDLPRRLEPVLRSGALFVPHADVHVYRPQDGVEIGRIGPCHAIPDMLRVDEDCNVYIAEESGHVVSFGVGPRLTLVR